MFAYLHFITIATVLFGKGIIKWNENDNLKVVKP